MDGAPDGTDQENSCRAPMPETLAPPSHHDPVHAWRLEHYDGCPAQSAALSGALTRSAGIIRVARRDHPDSGSGSRGHPHPLGDGPLRIELGGQVGAADEMAGTARAAEAVSLLELVV